MEKHTTTKPTQNSAQSNAASYEGWLQVALDKGVEELFKAFLSIAKEHHASITYNKSKSVAAHFPTLDGKGKPPPLFSVLLYKSNDQDGLWLGYSQTNARKIDAHVTLDVLPDKFDKVPVKQGNNQWFFGYISSEEDIRNLFSTVSAHIG